MDDKSTNPQSAKIYCHIFEVFVLLFSWQQFKRDSRTLTDQKRKTLINKESLSFKASDWACKFINLPSEGTPS